jgi:hypothetical protein
MNRKCLPLVSFNFFSSHEGTSACERNDDSGDGSGDNDD